jgi:hypothetical protein
MHTTITNLTTHSKAPFIEKTNLTTHSNNNIGVATYAKNMTRQVIKKERGNWGYHHIELSNEK